MSYKLPMNIKGEKDLEAYKKHLLDDIAHFSRTKNENNLHFLLQELIGKFIILETAFGFKKGKLLQAGNDYIRISCTNNQNQMLIAFSRINSIILPQGN